MNKIMIMGRICKDLELKYSQAQEPMAMLSFSVAVPRKYKKEGQPDCDFMNVKAFGKLAENIKKYFYKGRMINIIGRLQMGSYEKDGVKIYTTDIMVEEFNFTGEKKEDNGEQAEITADDDSELPF